MKHIHIVEPYHSIAMQHMSKPLLDELPKLYEVTTGEDIDDRADLNIHIPWHTLAGKEKGESKHIIAYTHVNPPSIPDLLDACEKADSVVAMSYDGRRELVSFGVDPKKILVNYCAADNFPYRRRSIAIVGFPQPNGRKREHMLLDMAWQYNLSMYEFVFVGGDWGDISNKLASLGVAVQSLPAVTREALSAIYQQVDALLVTGYTEGGPLPLLEAMASGVKVFSPKFGYAADLLEEDDLYTDVPDLMSKFSAHFRKGADNHFVTQLWKWKDYAAEYALIIGRMLGESVDLFPERGMSRYAQLLDVVDEVKPRNIVEIGTWKGDSALRMIQQAAKYRPISQIAYQGFDLFGSQTAEDFRRELSKAGCPRRIVERRLAATGANIDLIEGYTSDTLHKMLYALLYFVDGGHSEETIEHDAGLVLSNLGGGVAVFDDYYHAGKPEGMGCNKVIDNLDRNQFEVTHLPARTLAPDGREIGMVKVRRNAAVPLQMSTETYTYVVTPDGRVRLT